MLAVAGQNNNFAQSNSDTPLHQQSQSTPLAHLIGNKANISLKKMPSNDMRHF